MIFVLDNYDSFTWNLVQRLGEIDPALKIEVARNDQVTVEQVAAMNPEKIIVSPGPCTPREAGISKDLIARLGPTIPTLGVCLGHQCLGEAMGGNVVRNYRMMHGKVSLIHHDDRGVFAGLRNPFEATRYHSLVVTWDSVPPELEVCAWTDEPGEQREIMGLRHRKFPIHGVQFHPESFLTIEGIRLLQNFLSLPTPARVS